MIGGSEVGREELHGGQVDRSIGEHVEDHRKPTGGPGDFDPVVRLPLREPQGVPAIDEQRRITFPQVHIARVQLREVGDDLGGRIALAGDEALHLRDELGVGEATQASENIVLHAFL